MKTSDRFKNRYVLELAAVAALALTMAGCASLSASKKGTKIELLQNADMMTPDGEHQALTKNQTIFVSSEPRLIEAPGYLSTLVLPATNSSFKLQLKKDNRPECDAMKDQRAQDILQEVDTVESLLAASKAADALERLDELQRKYPNVTYLNFLRASCLVMLGELDKARATLSIALEQFPNNQAGQALMKQLTSGRMPSSLIHKGSQK